MAKPRRFSLNWQPPDPGGPNTDPKDNFDSRFPLGDIRPAPRPDPEQAPRYHAAPRPYYCQDCGGSEFWQPRPGGRWLCSKCRPAPKYQPLKQPETARVIPASLQEQAPDIQAGIAARERRRAELGIITTRPAGVPVIVAESTQPLEQPRPEKQPDIQRNEDLKQPAALQPVKFWPLMGISAARHNEGGAWRAWTLAKSLDKPGRGAIPLAELQALAKELDIHPKAWRRWLAAARRLTLIRDTARGWIVLVSHPMAAVLLGCEYAGPRPASITAGDLAAPGWRAFVWAAYEATQGGRPISRAKQQDITGVPISTQRAYDNKAGVDRRPNYAVSDRPASEVDGAAEFENKAAPFKFWNVKERRWVLAWRLPDSRTASAAESLQRGRSRKIAKKLKRLTFTRYDGLSILGQASSYGAGNVQPLRLFHRTGKQVKATERKLTRADMAAPGELFLIKQAGKRADLWRAIPQGGGLAV